MVILGVDPGTAVTGYGVIADNGASRMRLIECGVIRTDATQDLASRLGRIYDGITEVIVRHKPGSMAIESAFYSKNVRTTLVLGHARGVILLAANKAGIDVFTYSPTEIKKAVVGIGSATKEQVQYMLAKLLGLRSAPAPSDAADGVATALAHLHTARLASLTSQVIPLPVRSRRTTERN